MEELAEQLDRLMGRKEYDRAEALLRSARQTAAHRGLEARELSVCSEQMGFYRMRSDPEGFSEACERAMALLSRLTMSPVSRGTVLINAATGLVAFDRCGEALELYRRAEACYDNALPVPDSRRAALYNNMAFAYALRGDWSRAMDCMDRAVEELKTIPHHPDLALSYVNYADICARADGDDPRIGTCLETALAVLDDPEMVWDGYYAHTARKCAAGLYGFGLDREARELEERAEIIYEGT